MSEVIAVQSVIHSETLRLSSVAVRRTMGTR